MKNKIKFLSTLVFLYIVLFEFIIPSNKYFPKPSIILDSFSALFSDYNLLPAAFLTLLIVLFSLLFSYLLIYFLRANLISFVKNFPNAAKILNTFRFVSVFFVPLFLIFVFGANFVTELIFTFLFAVIFLFYKINEEQKSVSQAYIDSAESLNIPQTKIYKDIYWKSIEPELSKSLRKLHLYLWAAALLFEYIVGYFGIGSLYLQGYLYKDVSAIFALTIIVFVLIAAIDGLIYLIEIRTIFWSGD